MKYIILISCLIAVTYAGSESIIAKLISSGRVAEADCRADSEITDDEIKSMKKFEIPTTTVGKCFVFCIIKKLNFMTEDGKFIQENGYKFIDQLKEVDPELHKKLSKVATTCYAEVEELSDPCETATNMHICVEKEKKVNGVPNWEI